MIDRPDRRAALKERHRRAIVEAAASLMRERRGRIFTVDELAERADVARRTVFNHFASVDDIVTEVCSDVLGEVVETFLTTMPAADREDEASLFDGLAHALRATDWVAPMSYLTTALGPADDRSAWRAAVLLRAFTDVSERLSAEIVDRRRSADPLEVHLLVGMVMSGLVVAHHHWAAATGAADDDASRRLWSDLLERVIAGARSGFGRAERLDRTPVP